MKSIRRILLILDPSLARTPAMERAVALARALKADLWLGLFDAGSSLGVWGLLDRAQAHDLERRMRDQESVRLEDLVRGLREYEQLSVNSIDDLARPNAEHIVAKVQHYAIDLVIKDVGHDSVLQRLIHTPLDWELLRTCPVPMWLVAAKSTGLPARVAMAFDPLHPEHGAGALNEAILAMARSVAAPGQASLRLLSAFAGLPTGLPALDPAGTGLAFPYEEFQERLRGAHRAAFDQFLAQHGVPHENAEVLYGPPAAAVLEALGVFHPDVLVVGSLRRQGLDRVFMGSTAERLVGRAGCDVLVVPVSAAVLDAPSPTGAG